jgi:hypothetical protein
MNDQLVVLGSVKADGSIELDEKLPLHAGRVRVTIQPVSESSPGARAWNVLEQIWAERKAKGLVGRSQEEIDADIQRGRNEWDHKGS